jgi:adenylate kinase family enzyme
VRLLLLAPPGAGKGTQGERLAAWAGVRHIAAGDLLRAEAQAGGRLSHEIADYQARGDLVPDQVVLDVLTPAIVEAAARGGYILDGFPRTLPQAIAAAELAVQLSVTLDAAIYLYAPEEVLTRRCLAAPARAAAPTTWPTRLRGRTEGWAAGLRLAALSLAGHPDPERFAAEFSGTDRSVADLTGPEIASELFLSVNTVSTHTRHLYAKLGVHNRHEAVDRARALGLLAPSTRRA